MSGIAFNQILDPPEYHFHENGLRASPSAENTTEDNSEQNDKHYEGKHPDAEQKKILWPECNTKENKTAFQNIEEKEGTAIYTNKRKQKKKDQVH
jgi:hypothetical protein